MEVAKFASMCAVCTLILGASTAAEARDMPSLESLLREGKMALMNRDGASARPLFLQGVARAKAGVGRWRMLLGLALSYELEGNLTASLHAYRRFIRESQGSVGLSEPWPERRRKALTDVQRIEREVLRDHGRVDLQSDPAGATILVNGIATEHRTPAVMYLAGGHHDLQMRLDGYRHSSLSLFVEPGQRPLIHRRLEANESSLATLPAAVSVPSSPLPEPAQADASVALSSPSFEVPAALTLASGSALLLAAGALNSAVLRDAEEVATLRPATANIARDDQLRARIEVYQPTFITGYVLGAGLVATGATLLIVELSTDEPASANVSLGPRGVSVAGHF